MAGSALGLRLPLFAAILAMLIVACGSASDKTSEQIYYRCECPQFKAAVAQPPLGASWWPSYWETGMDLGTIYASGSVTPDDVKTALNELRTLFGVHDWEVSEYPNQSELGSTGLMFRAPESLLDGRDFDFVAVEFKGELLIHFHVDDPIRNYTGWDDNTYVRALDEGWSELYEADAIRDERAASLYQKLISGF